MENNTETQDTQVKKSSPILIIVIVTLLLVIGVGLYYNNETAKSEVMEKVETNTDQNQESSEEATIMEASKKFTITSANFSFTPNMMKVKKGDKVQITLSNKEGFHDLKIDEFDVATNKINGAGTEIVEFVADESGTFEYYCSVGTHRVQGMVGKLIVE